MPDKPDAPDPRDATLEESIAVAHTLADSGERLQAAPRLSAERFQLVKLLGRGGMGEVHKAYDPTLRRHVALKILRKATPATAERLLVEAQAQARVEHPNVCRVYGVGEFDGQPFIALQLIEGQTLREIAPTLTLDERVRILRDVAEALHAAHRLGLVHRDVKPSNVLLARNEDGRYHPYVADFGLAREVSSLEAAGSSGGTPLYMAPEQIRGDARSIDRRTDVYSLGATLYELMCGRPPFDGPTVDSLLQAVLHTEAQPLRKVQPSVPADLETIAMKCLAKDPQARYETARALAADLGRYLDGEPIQARPMGLGYRLGKWARKHRTKVAAGVLGLVVTGSFGALWLKERGQAVVRERLGQELGREVERIDSVLRYAALLPLHDTRRERVLVERRMAAIADRMHQMGAVAEGPGHYALGRGYAALRRLPEAERELRQAWKAGARGAEVSYALGQVLGRRFEEALAAAEKSQDLDERQARVQEAARSYREPALEFLRQARGLDLEVPEYAEGLMAYYEKRLDEAERKAEEALLRAPWLHEALVLIGDCRRARFSQLRDAGDVQKATASLDQAGESYRRAVALAASSSPALEGECQRQVRRVDLEVDQSRLSASSVDTARAACDAALVADPDSYLALEELAELWWQKGRYQASHGEDPRPTLALSVRRAADAAVHHHDSAEPAVQAARALYQQSEWELEHGDDPRATVETLLQAVERALHNSSREAWAHALRSLGYLTRASYEATHGLDPRPAFAQAIDEGHTSVRMDPSGLARVNLGSARFGLAAWQLAHGIDPRHELDEAQIVFDKFVKTQPGLDFGYLNGCAVFQLRAEYLLATGADPTADLDRALSLCERGRVLDGNDAALQINLGTAHLDRAEWLSRQHKDPLPELGLSLTELSKATVIDADNALGWHFRAETYRRRAEYLLSQKRSASDDLAAAGRDETRALVANAHDPDELRGLAETHRLKAMALIAGGARPDEELRAAMTALDDALKVDATHPTSLAERGAVLVVGARVERDSVRRQVLLRKAEVSFAEAYAHNALLAAHYKQLSHEAASRN